MWKFPLKFGLINKKLLMPAIAAIIYMIMDIIEYETNMVELHLLIDLSTRGFSYAGIIIVPIILNCFDKKEKNQEEKNKEKKITITKKTILHFFILHLTYVLYFGAYGLLTKLKSKDSINTEDFRMSHYSGLCTEESVEIIIILVISIYLLKSKFYIHHFIGLILFVLLSLVIDIQFNLSFLKPGLLFAFIYLIFIILDAFFISYEKYMMDVLYYSPYTIVCSIGVLFLATCFCVLILIFIFGSMMYDGKKYKLPNFSDYFSENDYKDVLVHFFYKTSCRFFLNILKILTIFYFTQNHIYTTYIFIKLFDLLLKKENNLKYISILFFIFQFLGLLVYLEIVELNFCNLNENTKKNIREREMIEKNNLESNEDGRDSLIEISPGYILKDITPESEVMPK